METFTFSKLVPLQRLTAVLAMIMILATNGFAQIATTTPSSRCGEGIVVLHATATSGTINWYTVPFYGTPVGTGNSFTTPSIFVTTTYYVDAVDAGSCSLNGNQARIPVIATISANAAQAIIFYESNTFCSSVTDPQEITRSGTAGGTFTASPSGLALDASTGAITPSSSTVGTYTVTYTVIPAEGCIENPASTEVTITTAPVQPVIAYSGSPFCTTNGTVSVSQSAGNTGGTYTASPAGLTIHASTGTITPATSISGDYTITYSLPASGGCAPQTATASVVILQLPTAAISYASPFTINQGVQSVNLTGTGIYTGGTYSSTSGLTIDGASGAITPATSTAGTYTVTYTLDAVSPCALVSTTTSVSIYPLPTATVTGTLAVCQNSTAPDITFTGAAGTPPYTFTYNLNAGPDQTITTITGSSITVSQPTALVNTYIYTLTNVSDAHGSSQAVTGQTATITVNAAAVASFTYTNSPFCSNSTDPLPSFLEGGIAGTFSSTSGLTFIDAATGEIDLSASTAGSYTLTNTIAATGGCSVITATSPVIITLLPVATFSYASSTYCTSGENPTPTLGSGAAAGTFSSVPAGVAFISASTGEINLASSTPGSYTINNTIDGINGCAEVVGTFELAIGSPPATPVIAYSSSPFCNTITEPQFVERTGESGGTYTADPSGLTIDSGTGAVTPSTSTPGSYTVTYTVNGGSGCSAVTTTASVVILQSPVVSNGSTKTICSGTNTDITLTSSMASTYTWTLGEQSPVGNIENAEPGSGGSIDQTLNNLTFSETGTIPYIVTATSDENSCASNSFTITVSVLPAINLVISDPDAVCAPNTVDLTAAAVTTGSSSGLTYTYWTDAAATAPLAGYTEVSVTGRYYIKGTTTASCISILPVNVTVNPLPTASISGTTAVCQGATSPDITFTGANASAPYTFTYNINNNTNTTVTTVSGNSVSVAAPTNVAGTFVYNLVSVTDASSTSCLQNQTGSATITVDPTTVAGTVTGGTTVCTGSNSTGLTLTGNTGNVLKWQYSTDNFATDIHDVVNTTTTLTASGLTATTYYRAQVLSGVCVAAYSSVETITVVAMPSWDSYSLTPTSLCIGGTVDFSVAVTGGAGGEITWIRSATSGGSGTTVTTGDAPAVGTWYYRPHFAPTGSGCSLADGTETTVTVVADPTITTQPTEVVDICQAGSATLSVVASGGTGTFSYQWQYDYYGGSYENVSVGSPIGATYTGGTTADLTVAGIANVSSIYGNIYKCIVTSTGAGCNSVTSDNADVHVYADPSWLSITSPATSSTYGSSVSFAASVKDGLGGTITWIRSTTSGGAGTTVTSPDSPPAAGTYYYRPHYEPTGSGCNLIDGAETTVVVGQKALTAATTVASKAYNASAVTGTVTLGTVTGLIGLETLVITPTAANYANANIGTGKATTISYGLANGTNGGLATNYSMANLSTTGDITAIQLTIANPALTLSREYNATTTAVVTAGALTGVLAGETANVSVSATASYADANVGTGKTITVVYTLSGSASGNYTKPADYTVNTGIITARPLTAATTVASKAYNASAVTGTVTLGTVTGLIGSETLVITPTAANYANANVGTGKATTISYARANGTNGGLASNYSMANLSTTGDITAKQLTIANPALTTTKTYDGNTTAAVTPGALSGVETIDISNVGVTAAANYNDATVAANKTITVVYTLTGTAAGNYIKPVDYSVTNGQINPVAPTGTSPQTFCSGN